MPIKKAFYLFFVVTFSHVHPCSQDLFPVHNLAEIEQTVLSMSLDQKIGQLIMAAAVVDEPLNLSIQGNNFMHSSNYTMHKEYIEHLIKNYHIGGIIYLGYSTPELQLARTNYYQKLSTRPLLIGQDLEWGLSTRIFNTVRFPHNMTLGALQKNDLIGSMAAEVARQAKMLGVHIIFAPVVDVNNNSKNPVIHDRSFGSDPHKVAAKGTALMHGLQSNGIIACAKHFPGHGDTATDSHYALPRITHDRAHLDGIELVPFKHLISEGVKSVMIAHLEVTALEKTAHLPTSLSAATITGVLRNELGFNGLVFSDGLGMQGILAHHAPGDIELKALLAGTDIVLCPVDVPKAHARIKQAVIDGTLNEKVVNKKVINILRAKEWALAHACWSTDSKTVHAQLHTQEAYDLKKKLYYNAITLACDTQHTIPLKATDGAIALIEYNAHKETVFARTLHTTHTTHTYIVDKTSLNTLPEDLSEDTIIFALYSMNKYKHQNFGIAQEILDYMHTLYTRGKKLIIVIFGSPYSLELLPTNATCIVAYEDDKDAQEAAAEVIAGTHKAQAILPIR